MTGETKVDEVRIEVIAEEGIKVTAPDATEVERNDVLDMTEVLVEPTLEDLVVDGPRTRTQRSLT